MIKKILLLYLSFSVSFAGLAQTIAVKKENARIKNEYGEGFEVVLEGSFEEVDAALVKWMKNLGKTKKADNVLVVNEPVIAGVTYEAPLFSQPKQTGNLVSAWMGILPDEWSKKDLETINPEIRNQVYDFAIAFQREKIQRQIDESVRASQTVERQQQRLQNQNRDLNTRIEDNKREKIQLEKSLADNAQELITLTRRLEKNQHDQDSVAVAGEQIKKVIELHKERLQKVN